ncbi:MAG: COX15/CtaA family protein [Myxococcota bacterium]
MLKPRTLFVVAVLGVVATWLMLLIGGTVNPTGSSLACTWTPTDLLFPTCNGSAFPTMEGGVLYEHGHRLWGWMVGVLTTTLLIGAWAAADVNRKTKWLAVGAFFLVLAQGALGGLTVFVGLNPILSTAHLVTGYSFLAVMVLLAWRLAPSRRAEPSLGATHPRNGLIVAAALTLLQILIGGGMRHFGAGMICGDDPIGCGPQGLWPDMGLQQLHMVHRFVAYLTAIVVVTASVQAMRRARRPEVDRPAIARLAWVPLVLVLAQVALGLLTIITGKAVAVVMFHTAIGGLLLAALVAVVLGFGPLGARLGQRSAIAPTTTPPASTTSSAPTTKGVPA